ncbi:LRR domain containing protein [Trema orientale]|uniref:LRR domain containing protein n=1 Tax=Trema orientale TaxID=63057 RepID=A0A2P5FQ37_TREOI|nr:LRR domain containing protein [Trema orientale]
MVSPMINNPTISISTKTNLHSLMVSHTSPSNCMFPYQLLDLKCLRMLSLSGFSMKLPTNIGDLIHLRYLSLFDINKYMMLPPTIGNLLNLQTLRILQCFITELPEEAGKLINLRHLYTNYRGFTWPKSIGKLRSLQSLKTIRISRNSTNKFQLRDFQHLNSLRDLYLEGLGTEEHLAEAKEAQFHYKTALVNLALDFNGDSTRIETHEAVLEILQPHENLRSLVVSNYCGQSISPIWMMSLINLRKLRLSICRNHKRLPPLGKLPCLESLDIVESNGLKKIGPEFLAGEIDDNGGLEFKITPGTLFPKLKLLRIEYAPSFCEWTGLPGWKVDGPLKIMPRLESLRLIACPSLESLPDFLQSTPLKNLMVRDSPALQKSCKREIGKSWPMIRHVPHICN